MSDVIYSVQGSTTTHDLMKVTKPVARDAVVIYFGDSLRLDLLTDSAHELYEKLGRALGVSS